VVGRAFGVKATKQGGLPRKGGLSRRSIYRCRPAVYWKKSKLGGRGRIGDGRFLTGGREGGREGICIAFFQPLPATGKGRSKKGKGSSGEDCACERGEGPVLTFSKRGKEGPIKRGRAQEYEGSRYPPDAKKRLGWARP